MIRKGPRLKIIENKEDSTYTHKSYISLKQITNKYPHFITTFYRTNLFVHDRAQITNVSEEKNHWLVDTDRGLFKINKAFLDLFPNTKKPKSKFVSQIKLLFIFTIIMGLPFIKDFVVDQTPARQLELREKLETGMEELTKEWVEFGYEVGHDGNHLYIDKKVVNKTSRIVYVYDTQTNINLKEFEIYMVPGDQNNPLLIKNILKNYNSDVTKDEDFFASIEAKTPDQIKAGTA